MLVETYRRRLLDIAFDRYGFVTTADAEVAGVPPVELRKLAQRGGVEHVAYGLYRFDDVPRTGLDQYMEAVLRVGPDAHLTADSVLAMLDLTHVELKRIRVGTWRRARPRLPRYLEIVVERVDPADLTHYEGIPAATVEHAIRSCRGRIMSERLIDAATEAARRGLVSRSDQAALLAELEGVAT